MSIIGQSLWKGYFELGQLTCQKCPDVILSSDFIFKEWITW